MAFGSSPVSAAPSVVINELHYNPLDDNPANEFLELLNLTGVAVDLNGWCVGGIGYCFPAGSAIGPHGMLVLSGAQYSGALSNSGERIRLTDAGGATVDQVEYQDHGEWPAFADGEGDSLQRRDPASSGNHPGNWNSAPPSPGGPNALAGPGLLPTFRNVEHTVLPAPGQPIVVTAELGIATQAQLAYRVGLGPETLIDMSVAGGVATAAIPGQAAGQLIRYRLHAIGNGLTGTWPRQGDGANYRGTTVAQPDRSALPTFELFMPDNVYDAMIRDLSLSGDDGYPTVVAFRGEVFDNARIRVKGQSSRGHPKKKLKVVLPAGYELESDLFPEPINEWAMHSSWSDRSFLRETLASEMMTAAGARSTQAFPIRVERNNGFYGLYTYIEQPDGTYRDRYGLDDSEVYEVGPDMIFGTMAPDDVGRSQAALRARYEKETFEYLDDRKLRDFIWLVNRMSGPTERAWIYANVDVPSVVNAIAVSMVIQHQDWGNKNYRLVFDQRGLVGVTQNDFDLTFGRRWSMTGLGGLDPNVFVGGAWEQPGGPFFETFFYDPELAEMLRRRVRTVTEELFNPDVLATRVEQLAAITRPDAVTDRAVWGTFGGSADPTAEARRIVDAFVRPQFNRLLGPFTQSGRVARWPQPAVPAVRIEHVGYDGVQHVVVRNHSGDSVDISGFKIPQLDFVVPGGTVLLPGRSAIFVHEDAPWLAGAYPGHLLAGVFEEDVAEALSGFELVNRAGTVVASHTLVAPGQVAELHGQPNSSALLSLVATQSGGAGWLQVLACGTDPGATSNLNLDGYGQTRSGLALARFDADGRVCLYNSQATHMVVDLQGYVGADVIDDVADVRLIDTRGGPKPGDGGIVRLTGRPNATGIVNLVATETDGPGYLAVVPCEAPTPATSNLNYDRAGFVIVASLAFVRFDASGSACVYVRTGAHVVADLQAYVNDAGFEDLPDARLIDTRGGPKPGDRSMTVITGRPNSTAVVSLVATESNGPGHLQVLPCNATPGATSNLNYDRAGFVIVNGLTTVQFDAAGQACVFAHTSVHLVADLQGYYAPTAFDDVPDVRLLDTRLR